MDETVIRECVTIEEFDTCVRLQRQVFGLPDLEVSPRRHLIVSQQAGGWTIGAFVQGGPERLVGFVHQMIAIRAPGEIIGYSHMMAVAREYQNRGLGARLKWAQRARALAEGRSFLKWTWDSMQARNAHFNLNRLGVTTGTYKENFYGTDYVTDPRQQVDGASGIDSDRLMAGWELRSPRVQQLASGAPGVPPANAVDAIEIPANWTELLQHDAATARQEQLRVRNEFQQAFAAGLICAGFERGLERPRYLLYDPGVAKESVGF